MLVWKTNRINSPGPKSFSKSSSPSRTRSVASSAPSVDWCQASVNCSTFWTATSRLHCVTSRLLNSLDCYQSTTLQDQSTTLRYQSSALRHQSSALRHHHQSFALHTTFT